jgi:hypothetical protein
MHLLPIEHASYLPHEYDQVLYLEVPGLAPIRIDFALRDKESGGLEWKMLGFEIPPASLSWWVGNSSGFVRVDDLNLALAYAKERGDEAIKLREQHDQLEKEYEIQESLPREPIYVNDGDDIDRRIGEVLGEKIRRVVGEMLPA